MAQVTLVPRFWPGQQADDLPPGEDPGRCDDGEGSAPHVPPPVTSLPVVDPRGRLIGIVSQDDILGTFTRPDQAIHHEVTVDLILHDFALNPQAFTVTVRQGIVTLAGHPDTDEVGHSLAAAVRQVEGVIAVRDQLSYQAQHG
jgi:CBS domain-containing protein